MRIAVGSDHRGVEMRVKLIEYLKGLGQEVVDSGTRLTKMSTIPMWPKPLPGRSPARKSIGEF